jgi:pimeloyl-ACP methyl ester carboxylesterase
MDQSAIGHPLTPALHAIPQTECMIGLTISHRNIGEIMKVFTKVQISLVAAASCFALLCGTTVSNAQNSQPNKIGTVILVHGAWADGSSWSKVIPRLAAKGLNVVAVQLPLTSLAYDVATVERAIAVAPAPVLLVAHSYGGVVITEAGNDPKVVGLVYVAAFAPDAGESAQTLNSKYPASPIAADNLITADSEGNLKLLPKGILTDFAEDLPLIEKTTLIATQGPTAQAVLGTPVTTAAWRTKPSWFIIAGHDRIIQPQLEEFMSKRMDATTITADSCHVVMLSKPEVVTEVILRASHSFDK